MSIHGAFTSLLNGESPEKCSFELINARNKFDNELEEILIGETKKPDYPTEKKDISRFVHKFYRRDNKRQKKSKKMRRR